MRSRLAAGLAAAALTPLGLTAQAATPAPFSVHTDSQAYLPSGAMGPAVLRWNPCGTLRWAINVSGVPSKAVPGFISETRRAMGDMTRATGLPWKYAGTTTIRPRLAGGQLADGPLAAAKLQLVIAWDKPSTAGSLLALERGEAGETMFQDGGSESTQGNQVTVTPTQLTFAAIVLDQTKEAALAKADKHGNGLYRLELHEIGHAVGLSHVYDGKQIMNPVGTPTSPVKYQAGDLAGLRAVGAGAGCL